MNNNKRIERANKYILNLKDSPIDLPISKKSINHVYHLFVINPPNLYASQKYVL